MCSFWVWYQDLYLKKLNNILHILKTSPVILQVLYLLKYVYSLVHNFWLLPCFPFDHIVKYRKNCSRNGYVFYPIVFNSWIHCIHVWTKLWTFNNFAITILLVEDWFLCVTGWFLCDIYIDEWLIGIFFRDCSTWFTILGSSEVMYMLQWKGERSLSVLSSTR